MNLEDWSKTEKQIARRAFDKALDVEKARFLEEFKSRSARIDDLPQIWEVIDWAERRARYIDSTYDYRYSRLIHVFAQLVAEKKLDIADLSGLADEKLFGIKTVAEIFGK